MTRPSERGLVWHAGPMANSPSGDSVTERIVRMLETFTADRTVQTAAEIGRRAGLPSSTAHRQVDALVEAGLLERDDDHRVRLGMRLWELALRGSDALRLRQAAMPFMERVQAAIREHTQLAVLEQDEALFLERLSSPDSGANITRIAGRLPLHASSSGLVLLAYGAPELQAARARRPARAGRARDDHGCRGPPPHPRRRAPRGLRRGARLDRGGLDRRRRARSRRLGRGHRRPVGGASPRRPARPVPSRNCRAASAGIRSALPPTGAEARRSPRSCPVAAVTPAASASHAAPHPPFIRHVCTRNVAPRVHG